MCRGFALAFAIALLVSFPAAADDDYDIRDDRSKANVIERHRLKAGPRNAKIKGKKEKIRAAHQRVKDEVPGIEVTFSEHTGAPEIVGVARGRQKLTAKSKEPREQVARGFLQRNADLYGLTPAEVAQLKKSADYANPSGNVAWVELRQELNGLPVFRGEVRFAVTTEGEIVQSTGNLVPALEDAGAEQEIAVSAADAVALAAESVGMDVPELDDVPTRLEYFPLDAGIVTLAWSMILRQENAAYYIYVSAEDGELLFRKNLVVEQSQPATYVVYNAESPAPLSPSHATPGSGIQGALIPRTTFTVISEGAFNNLGWMTDGTSITRGNNADVGLDLVSPDGIDDGSRPTGTAFRVFDYPYNPGPGNPAPGDEPSLVNYRFGEVVHMFFWANRYHDRLYELGFTEAARNFQQDNFGRGGLGNDAIVVEGQDFSGINNANFTASPDGFPGRVQMYLFPGGDPDRSSGLDLEVFIHELTHGTSLRLHANGSGLNGVMSGGMGEGWSDFYARALTSGPEEDVNGVYAIGAYTTLGVIPGYTDNYYYGIRRFPYALISSLGPNGRPHNPLTFADVDPVQANLNDGAFPRGPNGSINPFQVHAIGEIWCNALLEVRARLIARLGWKAGNQLALQLVTDGMKLDPLSPTLLQGRNAILAANFASASASAATEVDIWRGFAARGMGYSASAIAPNNSNVVESFDVPNVIVGAVTIVGDDCDGNGGADPGETVVLSIPFTNPYQLTDINDAMVTVGATTISLGPLAPGQTVVRTFTVAVPSTAACGILYDVPISVVSSIGTVNKPFRLQLGIPTAQVGPFSFSSGNIAAPIVDDQTTEVPIVVTESGPVGTVIVSVRLNHTSTGDLAISLVAPDGTTVMLAGRRGGAGDNFGLGANDCSGTATVFADFAGAGISAGSAPFAGAFQAEAPLSGFRGHEMNGTWTLRVTDLVAGNGGTVGCVKLDMSRQFSFCCGVEGTPFIQTQPPARIVEECTTNGAPDPGEIMTMNFPLMNRGSGPTTNLVATLLEGGGVTPLSGAQSYGALSPIGPDVARPFTFAVDEATACGGSVMATFALSDGSTDLGTVSFPIRTGTTIASSYTFSNSTPIAIPSSGAASPYPSAIAVSGVTGTMTGMAVTLHNFSHSFPADVDLLLVGPGGQKFIPLSDVGGGFNVVNRTFTLDSAAISSMPPVISTGTFRPINTGAGDLFPSPAPPAPYQSPLSAGTATFTSVFGASNPNGLWSLYAVDDLGPNGFGAINGGWTLTFRTSAPACQTVAAPVIANAAADPQTLWPPDRTMHDITVAYDSGCASCTLSVTSNEPAEDSYEIVDAHRVRLRAERDGHGNDRVYTITITCANGAGTAVETVEVRVPHDMGPGGTP